MLTVEDVVFGDICEGEDGTVIIRGDGDCFLKIKKIKIVTHTSFYSSFWATLSVDCKSVRSLR